MDCKKFIQLVEEKKKRALEKKEAPLKWEQKLEIAAKAKAEAKERKQKAAKRNRRSVSKSDTDSFSDDGKKSRKRSHKKHRKHSRSDQVTLRRGKRNPSASQRDGPQSQVVKAVILKVITRKKGGRRETIEDMGITIQDQILILLIPQVMMRRGLREVITDITSNHDPVVQIL